jgi:hypothetical protein
VIKALETYVSLRAKRRSIRLLPVEFVPEDEYHLESVDKALPTRSVSEGRPSLTLRVGEQPSRGSIKLKPFSNRGLRTAPASEAAIGCGFGPPTSENLQVHHLDYVGSQSQSRSGRAEISPHGQPYCRLMCARRDAASTRRRSRNRAEVEHGRQ